MLSQKRFGPTNVIAAMLLIACHLLTSQQTTAQLRSTIPANSGTHKQRAIPLTIPNHSTSEAEARTPPVASSASPTNPQTPPFIDLTRSVQTTQPTMGEGINQDSVINLAIWMVVIMCLCGLTVLGLRAMNVRSTKIANVAGTSRIVDTLNLGKHRFVQLIEIGGRSVLVASDASGIRSVVPMVDQFADTLFEEEASSTLQTTVSASTWSQMDR